MSKTKSLIVLFIITLCACSQEYNDIPQKEISIEKKYEHIIQIANESFFTLHLSRTNDIQVKSVYPWLTKDIFDENDHASRGTVLPDTLFYIVNYTNDGGYAIVSDNSMYEGIVAMVENGNLNPSTKPDNPGFNIFLEQYKNNLLSGQLNSYHNIKDVEHYLDVQAPTLREDSQWINSTKYPNKIHTKWGQGHPYNQYCFTSSGEKALAGCLPVAFAQALTYYDYPLEINGYKIHWEHLHFSYPSNYNHAESSSRLIHELGVAVNAIYGVSGTTAHPEVMMDRLLEWGFSLRKDDVFHEIKMIHNVHEYGPALICAYCDYDEINNYYYNGHEWIIDGAIAQTRNGKVRFLYHCNWGWNGSEDGYFLSTAFNPYNDGNTDHEYKYLWSIIYFIEKP